MIDLNSLQLLQKDPDYVYNKRYRNSLKVLENRYPDGCPEHVIAVSLGLSEAELKERYEKIIACIRNEMGVKIGNE